MRLASQGGAHSSPPQTHHSDTEVCPSPTPGKPSGARFLSQDAVHDRSDPIFSPVTWAELGVRPGTQDSTQGMISGTHLPHDSHHCHMLAV